MSKAFDNIDIQLSAMLEVFQNNGCVDEANAYINQIKTLLPQSKYDKILFCLKEVCRIYELDLSNDEYVDSLANLKQITLSLQDVLNEQIKIQTENNDLNRFALSFMTWFEDIREEDNIIKSEFYYWEQDGYDSYRSLYINYDKFYKLQYGENYINILENINFINIKKFIEMIYKNVLVVTDGRLKFTIRVNEILRSFNLPYKLEKGKFINNKYKTSNKIEYILDYEQFERKIKYSEDMILHNDIMDKHNALNYISDAFCYFYSLFKKEGEKELEDQKVNIKIAKMVHANQNDKQYLLIKEEIEAVKRIINNDYDIRHNEYYRSSDKSKREILVDCKMIEYLYNKIYDLLYILRVCYKPSITEDELLFKQKDAVK